MNTWLVLPSKRPAMEAADILAAWRTRGYGIAIQRDTGDGDVVNSIVCYERPYRGYAEAVNFLAAEVLRAHPDCDWIVAAGDDTLPDPNKRADEIAEECRLHFNGCPPGQEMLGDFYSHSTFGVMQPTGDRFAGGSIDRICGSPWMGRQWCLRINQGKGPLWPEYPHMFADEELQNVALKYGVLWQRLDLIHFHNHFSRASDSLDSPAVVAAPPAHLVEANSREHWNKYKQIFTERKRAGFPGSEPL